MAVTLHLKNSRISFAHGLFTASAAVEGGPKKFGADFFIGPDTEVLEVVGDKKVPTTMEAAMLKVANDTWKGNGKKMLDSLEDSKKCYRDGDKKTDKAGNPRGGYEGTMYVTAKNATRPGTFAKDGSPVTQEDGVLYSGCYTYAIVELYGNAQPNKKGVFASLLGVRFHGDGDSFGGSRVAGADEFDAADGADADDIA